MTNQPGTNRDILINQAYATDEMLLIRQRTHELYSSPKVNFTEWVLDRIEWQGTERVLDVGTGPGTYFDGLAARVPHGMVIGGDLSFGMTQIAARHPAHNPIVNMDVQRLPFPDASFDVVLAAHMLYHVPDLDLALGEIKRVLKPHGVLLAATNSQFNLPEIEQLVRRAYGLLGAIGPDIQPMRPTSQNFQLEDGPIKLARHFYCVARYDLPGTFVFPAVQPAMDYLNSLRALREPQLPQRVSWDDFMSVMTEQIQRLINHFGEMVVNKLSGVLVGTNDGAFAQEYIARLKKSSH